MTQLFRYVISGSVAAGTTLLLLYILKSHTSVWYPVAASLSYATGFLISFALQKFWTFQNLALNQVSTQFIMYILFGVANIVLNGFFVYVLAEFVLTFFRSNMSEVSYVLGAQVIAAAVIAFESYFVYKYIIFRHPNILKT